ncbi:hypothetical protein ACWFRB_04780 [Rhodococcus sp. NPDC055112]
MVGHLVRKGGAVLAVLTVVAGGAVVGMGTAVGQTGSADEIWRNLVRPCYPTGDAFFPDRGPCYRNTFSDSGMLGNYKGAYFGVKTVEPGVDVSFDAVVVAQEAAFDVPAPEVNVDVASVTHHPPKGFEFVGVKVTGHTPVPILPGPGVDLASTVVVDPVTGDVTVSAPAGGWALQPGRNGEQFAGGAVSLVFHYKAPDQDVDGDNGFTFTGTGVPASNGWVATGNTRVVPVSGGIGSSGS